MRASPRSLPNPRMHAGALPSCSDRQRGVHRSRCSQHLANLTLKTGKWSWTLCRTARGIRTESQPKTEQKCVTRGKKRRKRRGRRNERGTKEVRGLCIAMGQYSSLYGCALGFILGGFDIVEVDVQDREQVGQWRASGGARGRGRKQNENKQRTLKHVTSWMTCRWSECARCDTLSHKVVCAQSESVREKLSCEENLSTPPVGYSGSLSTVNETNCNKKQFFKKIMSSLLVPSRLVPP